MNPVDGSRNTLSRRTFLGSTARCRSIGRARRQRGGILLWPHGEIARSPTRWLCPVTRELDAWRRRCSGTPRAGSSGSGVLHEVVVDQHDALVGIASSLRNRTLPVHVVLERPARALTMLGRIVKTIYILRYLRYLQDAAIRDRVQLQLNRGESRHELVRRLFLATMRTGCPRSQRAQRQACRLRRIAIKVIVVPALI